MDEKGSGLIPQGTWPDRKWHHTPGHMARQEGASYHLPMNKMPLKILTSLAVGNSYESGEPYVIVLNHHMLETCMTAVHDSYIYIYNIYIYIYIYI